MFIALLLASFGAESLQKSETEEANKLAEALDRFRRFGSWIKVNIIVCLKVRLRSSERKPATRTMLVCPEVSCKGAMLDGIIVNGKCSLLMVSHFY